MAFVVRVFALAGLPACGRSSAFEFACACVAVNFRLRVEEKTVLIDFAVFVVLVAVATTRQSALVVVVFGLVVVGWTAATRHHLTPRNPPQKPAGRGGV